jgi:transposase-like protein
MAHLSDKNKLLEEVLKLLAEDGFDGIGELLRIVLNAAMVVEREKYLGAASYERSPQRRDQANGFKPKTVQTRVGELELAVPQVRAGGFYPASLEKGVRSERALKLALAEMYVQGVSTRKVAAITEQLCGFEVTSTQVSRAAAELDSALSAWRNRPLTATAVPYLILDARYEKVRVNNVVIDEAVLVAVGIDNSGRRQVLGVSVALSEAEAHWRSFLKSLQERGLTGVSLIVSDDHAGLRAARQALFPSVPWQRCQFHLQQNAQAYVPRQDMRQHVAVDIRAIFNAPDRAEAERLLKITVQKYEKSAPQLASWLEENIPEGLTVFNFPAQHRRRLRTTNMLERINKEIRRRTRVATLFPNEASCLRLVSAVLMEISDDWQTDIVYLNMG